MICELGKKIVIVIINQSPVDYNQADMNNDHVNKRHEILTNRTDHTCNIVIVMVR